MILVKIRPRMHHGWCGWAHINVCLIEFRRHILIFSALPRAAPDRSSDKCTHGRTRSEGLLVRFVGLGLALLSGLGLSFGSLPDLVAVSIEHRSERLQAIAAQAEPGSDSHGSAVNGLPRGHSRLLGASRALWLI